MFRVYLRGPDQSVREKTTTGDPGAAIAAFEAIVNRADMDGSGMLAAITKNGAPVAYHKFSARPDDPSHYWRGRVDQLPIYGKAGRPSDLCGGKRVNVYLDATSLEIAKRIGGGNVSEGIRKSLVTSFRAASAETAFCQWWGEQPRANDTVDEAAQAAWLAACEWMQIASLPHTAGDKIRPTMGHHKSKGD